LASQDYDSTLHLPSNAVIEHISTPDAMMRPEAKLRIVAGGALISILDLLHPELQVDDEFAKNTIKEMHQEAGKSIMYSWELSQDQKAEVYGIYKNLNLLKPVAASAIAGLIAKGLDIEAAELAEWALMVMAIKETDPDIKLPTPILNKD